MDTREQTLSVLMFPWLAHGHITPFLELAKKLSQRNFYIYLCSTPINLSSIKLSEKAFPNIKLVELHLPSTPDLPPHYHTTKSLPFHLMPNLKKVFDMSQPYFSNLLKVLNPDLLIYDFVQPWAPLLASHQNIPSIVYFSNGAACNSYFYHLSQHDTVEFPYPSIYFHENELSKLTKMSQENISDLTDTDRYCQSMQRSVEIALIKSCREIEARYIDYLSFLSHKEFVPVGPLVQESPCDYKELFNFIEWLDKKEKCSVVFVSFGTEYFMSMEEIQELAYGLEYSKINFIWVLRFHEEEKIRVKDVLPKCFLERVGMRGMVVEGWAPQGKILEHHSIGGFVSHCGWSSVIEGMTYGIPIIAMPMQLDQPLNSRLVVELGVGMEVERDENGKYERGEVAKKINKVVIGKEGEKVRSRVKEVGEKLGMKGEEEIDMVVEKLLKICGRKGKATNLTR